MRQKILSTPFFADLRGFSPEMLDGIKKSGNHHFKQKWRYGTADRKSCQGRFSGRTVEACPFIAVVVNQELNIIPLRQGK
jgi:hypothetical protein